jgi:di/tricarboxylate transporter
MKINLFLLLFLLFSAEITIAQDQVENDRKNNSTVNDIKTDSLIAKLSKIEDYIQQSADSKCKDTSEIKWQQWVIVFFMPVTMLIFALIFTIKFRNSKELKFSRLVGLTEDVNKEDKLLSSSRFIALLTGLTAIFVITTLIMYYGYIMVAECNIELPLSQLWTIIAGLGIGVIPYGFNVWNRNNKENPGSNQEKP